MLEHVIQEDKVIVSLWSIIDGTELRIDSQVIARMGHCGGIEIDSLGTCAETAKRIQERAVPAPDIQDLGSLKLADGAEFLESHVSQRVRPVELCASGSASMVPTGILGVKQRKLCVVWGG